MRLFIDSSVCTGHGRCYSVQPKYFESDDDGFGRALDTDVAPGDEEAAQDAVASCPERAISLVSD